MERMCMTFYCDRRRGQYCCADCRERCIRRCLNHPDRCRLVSSKPPKAGGHEGTRHRLTKAEKSEICALLESGTMKQKEIAEKLGIPACTVSWYKTKLRMEAETNGEAAT